MPHCMKSWGWLKSSFFIFTRTIPFVFVACVIEPIGNVNLKITAVTVITDIHTHVVAVIDAGVVAVFENIIGL